MIGVDVNKLGLSVAKIYHNTESYSVYCPFGTERTPNAVYNPIKDSFKCYACGVQINKRASQKIIQYTLGSVEYKDVKFDKDKQQEYKQYLKLPVALHNAYIQSRGYDNSVISHFDVREDDTGIYFPVQLVGGEVAGVQKRLYHPWNDLRYIYLGNRVPLYNMQKIRKYTGERIYIVEGVFGVLNAYRHGFENVFALLGVSNVNRKIVNSLKEYDVHLIFDDDKAGYINAIKWLNINPQAKAIVTGLEADEIDWGILHDGLFTSRISRLVESSEAAGVHKSELEFLFDKPFTV
jgi:hypothetical protein